MVTDKMGHYSVKSYFTVSVLLVLRLEVSYGKHIGWKRALSHVPVTCGRPEVHTPMIVGGSDVAVGGAPWHARIRYIPLGYHHWCGGAVIADKWVVTASHCIKGMYGDVIGKEDFEVRVGDVNGPVAPKGPVTGPDDPGEQVVQIARIILHKKFSWEVSSLDHDIALIELQQPITFSHYVKPICLTEIGPQAGEVCMTTGWGDMSESSRLGSSVLQEVALPVLSTEKCRKWYEASVARINEDMHLCAGYLEGEKAPCQGDSGGPLVCQMSNGAWALQGVTSFGVGCARKSRPGVFTRVSQYLPWIYQYIKANAEVPVQECLDKASWCAYLPSHDCSDSVMIRTDTCCKKCATHHTGIQGCEYGDSKSWCRKYSINDCTTMPAMKENCCMLCMGV